MSSSKSYVSVSRVKEDIGDGFVTEKAPRTGLGLLPSGQVVALQVSQYTAMLCCDWQ